MRRENPKPGQAVSVFLDGRLTAKRAYVIMYDEHPIPGSCDLTTEFLMLQVDGYRDPITFTRHSILPETDQTWVSESCNNGPLLAELRWQQ